MENNKYQTVEKDDETEKSTHIKFQENSARTGRPDLNEINKRNAEESLQFLNLSSSYTIAGIMALFVAVVIILVYLFS